MIEINLLPEELRPKERVTTPYTVVVGAGGTLAILAACGLVAFYFLQLKPLEVQKKAAQDDMAKAQRELADVEVPQKRHQQEIQRRDLALKVKRQRALWSGILDAVWTVVDQVGDAWISSLQLKEEKADAKLKGAGPRMTLEVLLNTSHLGEESTEYEAVSEHHVAAFIEGLGNQPRLKDYRIGFGGFHREEGKTGEAGKPSLASQIQIMFQKTAVAAAKSSAPQPPAPPAPK